MTTALRGSGTTDRVATDRVIKVACTQLGTDPATLKGKSWLEIALKPLVEPFPAFIIEVKKADSPDADLKALARAAREQIDGRQYGATFRAEGIADIEKIGLAYRKNQVEICR